MATLEDKLLGEKLEYYCSSSDEDNNEDNSAGGGDNEACNSSGKSHSKQGPAGFTNADVCPPAPNSADACYRMQTSTNTGPKGVVQDWQRFKQLQSERREENQRQLVDMAKKLSMTTATAQEEEERKRQEEMDAELNELMSEDFLQQYQKQRMAEMMQKCGQSGKKFGKVLHLTTHQEFLECVENEDKHTTVVIHIYDRAIGACTTLNKCLDTLAADYPMLKFAKISITVAGLSRDFRNKGLPALLVYKSQTVIGNFVRVTDDLSDDFFASDVESFLIEHGIMVDKNLYN